MNAAAGNERPSAAPVRAVRRGGRPRGTKRGLKVELRVSAAEKASLRGSAVEAGLSVSEYVRRRALGRPVTARADRETRVLLRRIGVNLNQIARAANTAAASAAAASAAAGRPGGSCGPGTLDAQIERALDELRLALAAVGDGPSDAARP